MRNFGPDIRLRFLLALAFLTLGPAGEAQQRIDSATPAEHRASRSVGEGVFSAKQAERGEAAYAAPCGRCHGFKLNGAPDDPDMFSTPPIAGAKFLRKWDGRSIGALFDYTRATMPANNPSFLSDQDYIDLIAYMLAVSGLPAGAEELEPDPRVLERITISAK